MKAGVYVIETAKGEKYIGSAVNFASRWRIHRHHLRKGTHHNPKLQAIAHKHGVESLEFSVLLVSRPEDAVFFEQRAIDVIKPSLNAAPRAGSTLGYKHTEATKLKFKTRPLSYGSKGKKFSEESRRRISEAKRGRKSKRIYRPLSDETKQKIRQALIGRKNGPMSDEHKAKISLANKGKKLPPHIVEAMREAQKGKKTSPEANAKRVAAYKATCARRKLLSQNDKGF